MAKKKQTDPQAETAARIKRTEAYAERVRALFAATVNQILALNKTIPTLKPGVMFSFDDKANRKIAEQTEILLRRLHSAVTTSIETGITLEWDTANDECDELISSIFGKHVLKNENFRGWMERNNDARREFIARTERGLNLSKRVWKTTRQLRDEMEVAMTVAIGEGESAASMSRKVRQYLNDPDLMFRRFRYKDDNGNWQRKWKKRVMDANTGKYSWIDYDKDSYHDQWTGKGYYKSSAKNAMRVTRTETNMAYRAADTSRWKQLDFILGIHIQPSASHPQPDICDELAGDYPKTFKFTGWHPQCFCVMTPILPSNEEMLAMADTRANGEEYIPQTPAITQYPTGFNNFVKSNAENIKAARERGTEPYFLRENAGVVNGILNPPKTLTPQEIALERHAKRDVAKVQQSWNEHRINNIETSVQKGYLPKECLSGLSALSQEAFNARIISLQKTALRHTARTPEEINDIQKRWTAKQQRDATTKLVANNVLKLRSEYPLDVDFSLLEKLLADNNLTKMREEARNVAQAIKTIRAEEKALSDIIPNAHEWHKRFSIAQLQDTKASVLRTFSKKGWGWDINNATELDALRRGLEHEVNWMGTKGKARYTTWEVSQFAYQEKLAWAEKRIEMLGQKNAIGDEIKLLRASRSTVGKQLVADFDKLFTDDATDINVLRAKAADIKAKADQLEKLRAKKAAASSATASSGVPFGGMTDEEAKKALIDYANKIGTRIDPSKIVVDHGYIHLQGDQQMYLYEALKAETDAEHRQLWNHLGGGGRHGGRGGYVQTGNSFEINRAFRQNSILGKIDTTTEMSLRKAGMTSDDMKTIRLLDKKIAEFSMPVPLLATRYVGLPALESIFGTRITAMGSGSTLTSLTAWTKAIKSLPRKDMAIDPAFLSASTNEAQNVFYGSHKVKLQIEIPPGTPMYLTNNYQESEIVLGRGTVLEYLGVEVKEMKDRWGSKYKHVTIRCRVK